MTLQRFGGSKRFFPATQDKSLKILQTLSLGLKRQIWVLDFEGKKLIVGSSPTGILQLLYSPHEEHAVESSILPSQKREEVRDVTIQNLETPAAKLADLPQEKAVVLADKIRSTIQALKPLYRQGRGQELEAKVRGVQPNPKKGEFQDMLYQNLKSTSKVNLQA
jgi:flagellar biogenesis protein FliO